MNKELDQFFTEIIREKWKSHPVSATFLGIHDYDDQMGNYDREFQIELIEKAKDYLDQLKTYKGEPSLSNNQAIDLEILTSQLEVEIRLFEQAQMLFRNATIYPYTCLYGIYSLLIREFAPLEERIKSLLGRLRKIPQVLREGESNLSEGREIPRIWTEVALEITEAGITFFQSQIPQILKGLSEIDDQIREANVAAIEALKGYHDFLKNDVLPRAVENFAIGKKMFDFLLQREHLLPYDVNSLIALGKESIAQTEHAMEEITKEIDSTKSWREIIAELKEDCPSRDKIAEFYKERMERAKDFVQTRNLVTIPPEILRVEDTPIFERPTTPYAAYLPPPPFDQKPEGIFWVTPVDLHAPEEKQLDQLRGHNRRGASIVALHEAYPGHHLQLSRANKVDSLVRKQYESTVFIEGWALYCEEMMFEVGFYQDPATRLLQLKDQLWRSCRVVIDPSIHSHLMGFEDAVAMLVNVAGLEKTNAQAEVKRYSISPTQPMSYIIGKKQILELREKVRKLKGKNLSLKDFHDRLLSFGSIPISLIEPLILS